MEFKNLGKNVEYFKMAFNDLESMRGKGKNS